MPLPEPKAGENQDEWLKRCMGDPVMVSEFEDEAQRYAVCLSLWEKEGDRDMNCVEERKALPIHHTETSDGPWDGPRNEANLRNDGDADYYRQAYAWVDPDLNPDTKRAYKFIHHEISADGDVGPANIKACQIGIAVLNGARGGADIPDSDREGVWEHLAAHLRDAGLEPAPLSRSAHPDIDSLIGDLEIRSWNRGELRLLEPRNEESIGTLVGYPAIPYGTWSDDLGGFVERINPSALDRTLERHDVVCCRDHQDYLILGRVSAGTLRLQNVRTRGLCYECDLPGASYAQDLVVSIRRGDVVGNSFRFLAVRDKWSGPGSDGLARREILEMELYEVGPVTIPAYPSTSLSLRSLLRGVGVDPDSLAIAVRRFRSGQPISGDATVISSAIKTLQDCLSSVRQGTPEDAEISLQGKLQILRRRLEMLEITGR